MGVSRDRQVIPAWNDLPRRMEGSPTTRVNPWIDTSPQTRNEAQENACELSTCSSLRMLSCTAMTSESSSRTSLRLSISSMPSSWLGSIQLHGRQTDTDLAAQNMHEWGAHTCMPKNCPESTAHSAQNRTTGPY
jgi:hypothetical protein